MSAIKADAFVIEVDRRTVGIAVADGRAYRFYASDRAFHRLEGCRFPSVTAAERACRAARARG
ncbi:MAG TPA: hypothetical protein VED40_02190 [Azospirillaceae bacterium]|nr:hypothetical protein [Azospirillaceae bacterium]